MPVFVCLLGGWAYSILTIVVYFFFPEPIHAVLYLLPITIVTIAAAVALWLWIYKRGTKIYETL